jgi:DNA modification methylase
MGLEKTPQLYVDAMVGVFSEVKRVLRDDGTLWLNIGDSYAGSGKGGNPDPGSSKQATNRGSQSVGCLYGTGKTARDAAVTNVTRKTFDGIKAKDLIGIPWLLAFALRADGWYLRSDIIWHKPNPMPESVTDRPTKSHEYLFLLTKSERYYYDADAIKEPLGEASASRYEYGFGGAKSVALHIANDEGIGNRTRVVGMRDATDGRNKRSVWSITTVGYSEAHFATFPPKLIEPCILAGSAKGQTVLDPFGGAGTTGLVADRLGRDALLIELNPKYAEMARRRIHSDNPLFGDVA